MENRDWESYDDKEPDDANRDAGTSADDFEERNISPEESDDSDNIGRLRSGTEDLCGAPDDKGANETVILPSDLREFNSEQDVHSEAAMPEEWDAENETGEYQRPYFKSADDAPDEINVDKATHPEAFQPTTDNPPPTFRPIYIRGNEYGGRRFKKKHTFLKVVAFLIVVVAFIGVLEVVSKYDISISSNEDGIDIILRDRESDDNLWYGDMIPPTDIEGVIPPSDPGVNSVREQVPIYPAGGGVTLQVNQSDGQMRTLQEIYGRCISSIVLVNVELADEGYGTGTGIIMSDNGYIITNDHVIEGAVNIDIELQDGTMYTASLVGQDNRTDLAVLKIEADNLPPAQFGDSSGLQVGDEVAAIGNPLGLNFSLSNGIISALDRDVEVNGYYMTMIQTNAAINKGNSGGALINMNGQVIGITNMKLVSYSNYSTIEGMAFAIPTNIVKPIVDSIIADGYVAGRTALGIMCATLDAPAAESKGLPAGVYVSSVYQQSGSYGKLQEGDVITAANGQPILSNEELNAVKNELSVGDILTLTIYRDGETLDVEIELTDAIVLEE